MIINSDYTQVMETILDGANSVEQVAVFYEECSFLTHAQLCNSLNIVLGKIILLLITCRVEGSQSYVWIEGPPTCILSKLVNDVIDDRLYDITVY